MSTVVREMFREATYSQDAEGVETTTRVFHIQGETDMRPPAAVALCGVSRGDAHPDDTGMLCNGLTVVNVGQGAGIWRVVASYSSDTQSEADDQSDIRPDLRLPVWDYPGTVTHEEFVTEDLNGEPLVNKAGDPFPPYPIKKGAPQVRLTVWMAYDDFDPRADYGELLFHTNADKWGEYGEWEPGEAYMVEIRPTNETFEGVRYRKVEYIADTKITAGINDLPWTPIAFKNKGFNELLADLKVPCADFEGNKYSQPQFLNPQGGMLDANRNGVLDQDPQDLLFDLIPEADFPESSP